MRILRHADHAVTMEIYGKASSKATQEACAAWTRHRCSTSLLYEAVPADRGVWVGPAGGLFHLCDLKTELGAQRRH